MKQIPLLAQECVELNNVKGLFPKPDTTSNQHEEGTVTAGQLDMFHLSMKDDELLSQQGILYNQIGTTAG